MDPWDTPTARESAQSCIYSVFFRSRYWLAVAPFLRSTLQWTRKGTSVRLAVLEPASGRGKAAQRRLRRRVGRNHLRQPGLTRLSLVSKPVRGSNFRSPITRPRSLARTSGRRQARTTTLPIWHPGQQPPVCGAVTVRWLTVELACRAPWIPTTRYGRRYRAASMSKFVSSAPGKRSRSGSRAATTARHGRRMLLCGERLQKADGRIVSMQSRVGST